MGTKVAEAFDTPGGVAIHGPSGYPFGMPVVVQFDPNRRKKKQQAKLAGEPSPVAVAIAAAVMIAAVAATWLLFKH